MTLRGSTSEAREQRDHRRLRAARAAETDARAPALEPRELVLLQPAFGADDENRLRRCRASRRPMCDRIRRPPGRQLSRRTDGSGARIDPGSTRRRTTRAPAAAAREAGCSSRALPVPSRRARSRRHEARTPSAVACCSTLRRLGGRGNANASVTERPAARGRGRSGRAKQRRRDYLPGRAGRIRPTTSRSLARAGSRTAVT
jgi:hypothetical protein